MEQTALEKSFSQGSGAREERWRFFILIVVFFAIMGFVLNLANKAPLNGKVDPVSHVEAKRKQQEVQRKDEIDGLFKQGVAMLHAKQYEHALAAFHQVLKLAPQMPEAHVNAGYALLGLGQPKTAMDFFNSATELRPNQLNAYFGLAEALEALGDKFGAMQAMETYIHLAPSDDPFRRKAEAAAWELRAKLADEDARRSAERQGAKTPTAKAKP